MGSFKEFKLREELAGLIDKYNKKFYGGPAPPKAHIPDGTQKTQASKYSDKLIINPVAVPDPRGASAEGGNFSWMYLMTPYYN